MMKTNADHKELQQPKFNVRWEKKIRRQKKV